jgi:hypothetical protein
MSLDIGTSGGICLHLAVPTQGVSLFNCQDLPVAGRDHPCFIVLVDYTPFRFLVKRKFDQFWKIVSLIPFLTNIYRKASTKARVSYFTILM